jgi:hypothetical protein
MSDYTNWSGRLPAMSRVLLNEQSVTARVEHATRLCDLSQSRSRTIRIRSSAPLLIFEYDVGAERLDC